MTVQQLISELMKLSKADLEQVKSTLQVLENTGDASHSIATDISRFSGRIRLAEDPLIYQRRLRAEWL